MFEKVTNFSSMRPSHMTPYTVNMETTSGTSETSTKQKAECGQIEIKDNSVYYEDL